MVSWHVTSVLVLGGTSRLGLRTRRFFDLGQKAITLRQSIYLKKVLGRYGMSDCRTVKILIGPGGREFSYQIQKLG